MRLKKQIKDKLVYQFDLKGNLIQFFNGISDACIKLGINRSTISHAITDKSKCKGEFYFSRKAYINIAEYEKKDVNKIKKLMMYSIYKFDLNRNLIKEYDHIKYASLDNNISRSEINRCIKNNTCYNNKFYFSKNKSFEVKLKKRNIPKEKIDDIKALNAYLSDENPIKLAQEAFLKAFGRQKK